MEEENHVPFDLATEERAAEAPPRRPPAPSQADPEDHEARRGFAVADETAEVAAPIGGLEASTPVKPTQLEPRPRRTRRRKPPRPIGFGQIVTFPFYPTSVRAMFWLSFDLAIFGLFLSKLVEYSSQ